LLQSIAVTPEGQADTRQRSHFETVQQQVFGEMAQAHVRMKLALIAPYHALVLAILALRGYPAERLVVQFVAFLAFTAIFAYQATPASVGAAHRQSRLRTASLLATLGLFAVAMANTGSLMSPFLPLVLPMAAGISVSLQGKVERALFFGTLIGVFSVLALLSQTALGALLPPLAPQGGRPSPEYLVICFGAVALAAVHVSQFGTFVKNAYERVALELVSRREELCTEGEERTRAFEGIAARLAHEVKNPLAAIKGLSALVASHATDPKMAERLTIVASEADRLRGIVDGFLSFSRGLGELAVTKTRPYELARELVLLLETRAADAGLNLEVTGNVDIEINADVRKVRQILLNLVLNAMQASPAGGAVAIHVGEAYEGEFLRLRVTDRGVGMPHDVLERLGRPYFTTREGGTGLGVAVARGLIEQHGGRMFYESSPGKGTTVSIDLPRCALSSPAAQKRLPLFDWRPSGRPSDPLGQPARPSRPTPIPVVAAASGARSHSS
jgi:signal transduction histidine kinase